LCIFNFCALLKWGIKPRPVCVLHVSFTVDSERVGAKSQYSEYDFIVVVAGSLLRVCVAGWTFFDAWLGDDIHHFDHSQTGSRTENVIINSIDTFGKQQWKLSCSRALTESALDDIRRLFILRYTNAPIDW